MAELSLRSGGLSTVRGTHETACSPLQGLWPHLTQSMPGVCSILQSAHHCTLLSGSEHLDTPARGVIIFAVGLEPLLQESTLTAIKPSLLYRFLNNGNRISNKEPNQAMH